MAHRRIGSLLASLAGLGCGRVAFDAPPSRDGARPDSDAAASDDAVADAARCEPLPCADEAGAMRCGDRCYASCATLQDQASAAAACAAWGGELASLPDAMVEACVLDVITVNSWIGYEQAPGQVDPADGWSWRDGTPQGYVHWNTFEPNDVDNVEDGTEACAILYKVEASWNDLACGLATSGVACVR